MTRRGLAIELAVLTGLGVLLALLGPFGTFAMAWPLRLLDWLVFLLGGALFFRPVIGAARLVARHGAMRLPAAISCACLLAAFPTTLLVAWCLVGMGWRQVTIGALVSLYPEVLLVGGMATLLQFAVATRHRMDRDAAGLPASPAGGLSRTASVPGPTAAVSEIDAAERDGRRTAPAGTVATTRPVAFLSRLPPTPGGDLLCLENEDHYVRAHTSRGSTLILMRLGDAVAELDGMEGLRTHRSWWVKRDAVDRIVRRDRSVWLVLRNGVEAPVARAMVPVLRQAGWLGDTGGGAAEAVRPAAAPPA